MKKLTVLLSSCNKNESYLKIAIESILNQSFTDFSFIILDNGSENSLESLVKSYEDERICFVRIEENKKPELVLEEWFSMAETPYFLWTHDDDIMNRDMLQKQVNILDNDVHKKIGFVSPNIQTINENGDVQGYYNQPLSKDIIYLKQEFIDAYVNDNLPATPLCPAIMYRTEVVQKALTEINSSYKKGLSIDDLLELKINVDYEIVVLKDVLYSYRVHNTQESSQKLEMTQYAYEVIAEFIKNYVELKDYEKYKSKKENVYKCSLICRKLNKKILHEIGKYDNDFINQNEQTMLIKGQVDNLHLRNMIPRIKYMKKIYENQEIQYMFWGSGSAADKTKAILDILMPNMHCVGYIDGLKSGKKNGLDIVKASSYDLAQSYFIIIASTIVGYEVYKLLTSNGKEPLVDFMFGGSFSN